MPPTISVIGASGGVGGWVVKHALSKGYAVRALVRSPEKFQARMEELNVGIDALYDNVQMVVGQASDPATVGAAVKGADHVISCLGNVRGAKAPIVEDATRKIAAAMAENGVARLQIVSSIGIGDSWEQVKQLSFVFSRIIMPYVIAPTVKDLNAAESFVLEELGSAAPTRGGGGVVEAVIVRPPGLGDDEGTGEFEFKFADDAIGSYDGPGKYKGGGPLLPRSDVALAMVSMVEDTAQYSRHVGRPVSLLPVEADSSSCSVM